MSLATLRPGADIFFESVTARGDASVYHAWWPDGDSLIWALTLVRPQRDRVAGSSEPAFEAGQWLRVEAFVLTAEEFYVLVGVAGCQPTQRLFEVEQAVLTSEWYA